MQGFDPLRIRSDFVDDQERNLRVLGNDIEMRFNLACEFFEESSRFFVDAEESTGENFDLFLENTDEQLLFGAEVIVHESLVTAGFTCDFGGRGECESFVEKEPFGRFEDDAFHRLFPCLFHICPPFLD